MIPNDWLLERLAEARVAWPDVDVSDEEFVRHVMSFITAFPDYEKLRTSDLYFVLGCLKADPHAIAHLEKQYLPKIERALQRMNLEEAVVDDLTSALREQILFSERPQLRDYSGRGELGAWLRSAAINLALKWKRKERRHVPVEDELDGRALEANPEIEYLRRHRTHEFEAALAAAFQALPVRERNLLRQHYLDGLNIEALGTLYGVHRATAARWISNAREVVLQGVRDELAAHMSPSELESFLRATRSELGMRLSKMLRVR